MTRITLILLFLPLTAWTQTYPDGKLTPGVLLPVTKEQDIPIPSA